MEMYYTCSIGCRITDQTSVEAPGQPFCKRMIDSSLAPYLKFYATYIRSYAYTLTYKFTIL